MEANFSLSWDSYQENICNGLCALQQNGEFVDMTLAADGHHVKVHQLVMSLASPYIKDLISSAQCPHPVIFLNDVSHTTLASILQYIYTGEVLINKGNLPDLMKAAKALHIKGLKYVVGVDHSPILEEENQSTKVNIRTVRIVNERNGNNSNEANNITEANDDILDDSCNYPDFLNVDEHNKMDDTCQSNNEDPKGSGQSEVNKKKPSLQFTASNRGNLQMILNRFMYHLRYSGRRSPHRRWQCVDYDTNYRCNACVITSGDTLVKRLGAHNHPFHDLKIIRKTQTSKIYTSIKDAQVEKQMSTDIT